MFSFLKKDKKYNNDIVKKSATFLPFISLAEFSGFNDIGINNAYNKIPAFRSVIEQQANMLTEIDFYISDKKGNNLNNELTNLLNNPNKFQTKTEFLTDFYRKLNLYDIVYIYLDMPLGYINKNTQIFSLSYFDIFPVLKVNINEVLKRGVNIFDKATVKIFNNQYKADINNLFYLTNSGKIDDILTINTRANTLNDVFDNVLTSYEIENEMLKNGGAIGAFSPEVSKDGYGEFSQAEYDNLQSSLDKYGTVKGKRKYITLSKPAKFIPMGKSAVKLGVFETRENAKQDICDIYGHSVLLLNQLQGSTFSNMEQARASVYSSKIIPDAKKIITFFNQIFGNLNKGLLKFDISNVSALQSDRKKDIETDTLSANLIININANIKNGNISKETALNLLVSLGYVIEQAKILIL